MEPPPHTGSQSCNGEPDEKWMLDAHLGTNRTHTLQCAHVTDPAPESWKRQRPHRHQTPMTLNPDETQHKSRECRTDPEPLTEAQVVMRRGLGPLNLTHKKDPQVPEENEAVTRAQGEQTPEVPKRARVRNPVDPQGKEQRQRLLELATGVGGDPVGKEEPGPNPPPAAHGGSREPMLEGGGTG